MCCWRSVEKWYQLPRSLCIVIVLFPIPCRQVCIVRRDNDEDKVKGHHQGHDSGPRLSGKNTKSQKEQKVAEVVDVPAISEEPFRIEVPLVLRAGFPEVPCIFRCGTEIGSKHIQENPEDIHKSDGLRGLE